MLPEISVAFGLVSSGIRLVIGLPDRDDPIEAAKVRNTCLRRGVQPGTIDALLIRLCRRHDLVLLMTDPDFHAAARHVKFGLWRTR
jgi:hypothetical protein